MGNWRNRFSRRNRCRQEKLPSPTPLPYHPQPPPASGFWQDGIPYWEKKFCTLVGSLPWGKIVDAKNYMYGNSNVLNWDDSAGEEAFQNAKRRFWADINGLPCDISLPDPDIYIAEIDWNPIIDPEIIEELDREYYAPPDEGEENTKFGQRNKRRKNSAFVPDNHANPWECDSMQGSGNLKNEAQGWNGSNCINDLTNGVNRDANPWELGITQGDGGMNKNAWEDNRDESWGWNQIGNNISLSKGWDNGDSPWEHGCQGVASVKRNRWGDPAYKSWECNQQEPRNLGNGETPWECSISQNSKALNDRGWRNCRGDDRGWKQSDSHNNQKNDLDFRIVGSGRGAWNEGGQKREHSRQYISGYKSSRFQGSDYQTDNCWRRGHNRKKVSFGFE